MLLYVCLSVLVAGVMSVPMMEMTQAKETDIDYNQHIDHVFEAFKKVHNKQYENELELTTRKAIFQINLNHIKEHNHMFANGEKSYYLGINQFTDLTHKEFLKLYTGHLGKRTGQYNGTTFLPPYNLVLPKSVDWRKEGIVTDVKNQGQCGSCWSFSTTGSLEGQHAKATGKLISLSEQQLVDCSGSFGNQGCNGGLMDQAFEYIKSVGGIESEQDYPYLAHEELKCKFVKKLEKAEVTGFVDIESGSESKLQQAVASVGPVSIAIDASHQSFQMYAGGVYDEETCSSTELDHGVLIVGYGTYKGVDFWLVKNSWGESWGMEGYIQMSRNKDNQCGVATQASYPTV